MSERVAPLIVAHVKETEGEGLTIESASCMPDRIERGRVARCHVTFGTTKNLASRCVAVYRLTYEDAGIKISEAKRKRVCTL